MAAAAFDPTRGPVVKGDAIILTSKPSGQVVNGNPMVKSAAVPKSVGFWSVERTVLNTSVLSMLHLSPLTSFTER
eukprot:10289234-Prorocentrum_lima.AAC.1